MTDTPTIVLKQPKAKKGAASRPAQAKSAQVNSSSSAGDALDGLLAAQGFQVRTDGAGMPSFMFEGGTYYLPRLDDDPEFYQLLYPNFWELETEEEALRALVACDAVNREGKLVKLHLYDGDVWASVETLHAAPADFVRHLPQLLAYLQSAVSAFRDVMLSDDLQADTEAGQEPQA